MDEGMQEFKSVMKGIGVKICEMEKKILDYINDEWTVGYNPNALKVIFELEARRIPEREETFNFTGTIEFTSPSQEQEKIKFYHNHFRNLASKNLINFCLGKNDIIRFCKP